MRAKDLATEELGPFDPVVSLYKSLVGQHIIELCFELGFVGIRFAGGVSIEMASDWLYRDPAGTVIDRWVDPAKREQFEVWSVLGKTAAEFSFVNSPLPAFTMRTLDGYELEARSRYSPYKSPLFVATLRMV